MTALYSKFYSNCLLLHSASRVPNIDRYVPDRQTHTQTDGRYQVHYLPRFASIKKFIFILASSLRQWDVLFRTFKWKSNVPCNSAIKYISILFEMYSCVYLSTSNHSHLALIILTGWKSWFIIAEVIKYQESRSLSVLKQHSMNTQWLLCNIILFTTVWLKGLFIGGETHYSV